MRQLHRRVEGLERKRQPPKLHIVCCYGEQSEHDAIDQYGRDRIGDDDLIVVIRKPASTAAINGGEDATA
jgi:hypothetical protein